MLQQPDANAPDFADQVADIIAMIEGTYQVDGVETHVHARRTSGIVAVGVRQQQGPECAGRREVRPPVRRELPHHAGHRAGGGRRLSRGTSSRRTRCASPTSWCPRTSSWPTTPRPPITWPRRSGNWVHQIGAVDGAVPYPDPETTEPLSAQQRELVKDRTATQFVGDPDEVAHRLDALQKLSGARRQTRPSPPSRTAHADRLRSHELIATRWVSCRVRWPATLDPRCPSSTVGWLLLAAGVLTFVAGVGLRSHVGRHAQ